MSRGEKAPGASTASSSIKTTVVFEDGQLTRALHVAGYSLRSRVALPIECAQDEQAAASDPLAAWWMACLRGGAPQPESVDDMPTTPVTAVDLFAGVGGLMVGLRQLASEAGRSVICELAVDTDADALSVHNRNHRTRRLSAESVTSLVDYRIRGQGESAEFLYPPELVDESVLQACAGVDVVVAGPPCQGHSNLNNHSRRNDRRNLLYLSVPAFAVACGAGSVIVENVTSVVHDEAQVTLTTARLLESSGYSVTSGILAADEMGWPQTRKRHFLIARRRAQGDPSEPIAVQDVAASLANSPARSVLWAIGGEQSLSNDPRLLEASGLTALNRERIKWLFDNDEHDLALQERPECHREGTSYSAVYGRMHPDRPAPTITTGYMTPGRGRFVHPTKPRTLTPAEAARLQGFPVDYCFNPSGDRPAKRSQLAKWIGDAVAMPLGYAAAVSALAPQLAQPSSSVSRG